VLLIGFWFEGGLFKMATAVMFWMLLELGVFRLQPGPEAREKPSRIFEAISL
jgi:hypothetical protein